ncbi:helix-turn-helix domain-containing protein [Christiangramia sp. OXR-203]|uniref:helix-turn-helix domain-containing protein n=1 Tax=Christiangramia sp. OXR-203 TaxID=3100176 RepID=UPI002AC94C89|nr:helix-turn-helix domain-containing protein [Christiangramia sp. OXR-203]WPZ00048.1 helix-turn-helix domain-containing protein [Christiangramia sp. OXR-203]
MIFSSVINLSLYRLLLFVALTIFIYKPLLFAQDNIKQSTTIYSVNSSFTELHELEAAAMADSKIDELNKIVEVHLQKAKKENDPVELARAYYYRILTEKPERAIIYSDSMIEITENSEHPNYPTLGYILKANVLYDQGKFQPALDNFLKAYNLALEKNNMDDQREISLAIAAIRNINGQHYAAADLYKRSLNLLKQKSNSTENYYEDYSTLLYNLSLTYLRLSQLDTSKYYVQKGIDLSRLENKEEDFKDFVLVDAQINFYKKDFKRAKDTLLKYIDDFDGTSKAIKLYYLGKIEKNYGNDKVALTYFKTIDSIVSSTEDPFNEVKDVYQQLIINSVLEDEEKEQIGYIEKLIYYDSVLSSEHENIANQAIVAYDIPDLKRQKLKAENQLKTKNLYVTLIAILAGLAVLIGLYFFIRSRKMNARLKLLMEESEMEEGKSKAITEHPSSIPEEIRKDILEKLAVFEKSDRFMSKDLDMYGLAQQIGTNTTYLSTVINHYKKMNFPTYVKDLKIKAAINQLSKNPDLLKYNYQGLAEIFGFKTGESFSKAFYKKTGVYPSKFLNELKSR